MKYITFVLRCKGVITIIPRFVFLLSSMVMGKRGLIDYHLHTSRCGHAEGELDDFAGVALSLGLREIGYSDHFPLLHIEDPSLSMGLDELPLYVREVEEARERVGGLKIRLGIEVDYLPQTVERLRDLLQGYPFDYVMGSVHYVDGWGFDDPRYVAGYEGRDIYALWARYFELLGDAAECGLFDILAHPDVIKKFGYRPERDVTELYEACLDRVAGAGLAVEVSTAGLRKPVGEIYPGEDFLRLCRARDIPVTLGSDAHRPLEVGGDFEKAVMLLRKVGYGEVTLFEGRERSRLAL
jgi:histidinol-phosphatase (PHP family)